MKRIFSLLIIIIFIPTVFFGKQSNKLFDQANDKYKNGEYEKSINLYDSLIKQGVESSAIYYNMGNAWFKLKDVAQAIYYYEKAKKIEPNNPDIQYNIDFANSLTVDKIETVPDFFIKAWSKTILYYFSERQWTYINILSFLILLISISFFIINSSYGCKKICFYLIITFSILTIISLIFGYNSYKEKISHNTAIIFTPKINVKSAPSESSNNIFILHKGTKVFLLSDKSSEWQKIKIANGNEGWISESEFKII